MNPTDVQIGKVSATIAVSDDESLLHPAVIDQVVERVLAKLRAHERARGIAQENTRFSRSAAYRPDLLR